MNSIVWTPSAATCAPSSAPCDFLSAIVDYEDIELEKRARFARMLAEVLKDSQRHEPSDVTLTHHALHKQADPELDLPKGDAAGLASVLAAGSRGRHEAELVPWTR